MVTAKQVVEVSALVATAAGLIFLVAQTSELQKASKATIRAQLYERENEFFQQEDAETRLCKGTIWITLPAAVGGHEYLKDRLKPFQVAPAAIESIQSPQDLWNLMYGPDQLTPRLDAPAENCSLRRAYLYIASNLYHVHNAFDYWQDGILDAGEWRTWSGLISNIGPHPLLLVAIWDGYQNHYFSKCFAEFLQSQLCPHDAHEAAVDDPASARDRAFTRSFYAEMCSRNWAARLPEYGSCEKAER